MNQHSQFPLWFFVGLLLAGGLTALLAAVRSICSGAVENAGTGGPTWAASLVENAPIGILGLSAFVIALLSLACWRSR